MRRGSKGRSKKSDTNGSDAEGEVSGSVKADNDATESTNETESSNSTGRKRSARGQVKTDEEAQDNEEEVQENGKSPNKKKKKDSDNSIENQNGTDEEVESEKSESKKKTELETTKGKKKGKAAAKKQVESENEDEEEYEVEKIVDQRTIKGRRQFLVRWKGYTEESDTWEQEKELNCDRLVEEFLAELEENNESSDKEEVKSKTEKKTKAKKKEKKMKQKKSNPSKKESTKPEEAEGKDDDSIEYEVEKIIEVRFKKDKTRAFLIRWKGFSAKYDTWEPEEHLNCHELIEKFMEKLDKIKSQENRELRTNPSHTKRFTLTMYADKRQSRRNADKERVTYYECDV